MACPFIALQQVEKATSSWGARCFPIAIVDAACNKPRHHLTKARASYSKRCMQVLMIQSVASNIIPVLAFHARNLSSCKLFNASCGLGSAIALACCILLQCIKRDRQGHCACFCRPRRYHNSFCAQCQRSGRGERNFLMKRPSHF